jgi:hypothetical protein
MRSIPAFGFFHTQALNMSSNYFQILTLASWPTPSHRLKESLQGEARAIVSGM